jgi:predicted MFS family arabinose efflux permease
MSAAYPTRVTGHLYQAVYSIGIFLGPVIAGQIGGWLGYTMLFSTSPCVAALSTVAALKLPKSIATEPS